MHALTLRYHPQNLLQTIWRSIAVDSARQVNNIEYLCRKRKSSHYFQQPLSQSCSLQISRCHLQSCTFPYSQQCLKNRPEEHLAPNKLHLAAFWRGLEILWSCVWPQLYSHPLPLLCVWRHKLWVPPVTHFDDVVTLHVRDLFNIFFSWISFLKIPFSNSRSYGTPTWETPSYMMQGKSELCQCFCSWSLFVRKSHLVTRLLEVSSAEGLSHWFEAH